MSATVLQLSDTHLSSDPAARLNERVPYRRLEAVVGAVTASGAAVDLVVLSGDITDDASEAGARAVAALVAPLGAPVLAVPGNHDLGPEVVAVFGPARAITVGGWRVVGLATNLAGRIEGGVDPGAALAAVDDGGATAPTVVALHHPPRGPSTHPWFQLAGGPELLAGLALRPHVRLLVSGHLHQAFERRHGELTLLGAPSTVYAIRHEGPSWQRDDTLATGARLLHLGDGGTWSTELVEA